MSEWKRVAENIVRHSGGTYYLRAKVGGKVIRQSLKTDDLRDAKLRRDKTLPKLRAAAEQNASSGAVRTLEDALRLLESRILLPHLKPSTRTAYAQTFAVLRETLPLRLHGRSWNDGHAFRWWKVITGRLGPSRANVALVRMRQVQDILIEHGVRSTDATRHLKRIRPPQKLRNMPSRAEIESVIEAVRGQNKRVSAEVSSMIAFMAYSGMRVSEVRAVNWEDIGDEWILVRGEGPDGPKNRDRRMVPICPPMADLLARLRWDGATGPVFRVKSPRFALENACERL